MEIVGKHNVAKVFSDTFDSKSYGQMLSFCNLEQLKDSHIRFMPDVHAGKGAVVGTTLHIKDAVIPSMVGVDIGCGVLCIKLKEKDLDIPALDYIIKTEVSSGFDKRINSTAESLAESIVEKLYIRQNGLRLGMVAASLGTLGGGNHFIEIDKSEKDGSLYLLVHSGSRHLGIEVEKFYRKQSFDFVSKCKVEYEKKSKELIEEYKKCGKQSGINAALKALKSSLYAITDSDEAYCTKDQMVRLEKTSISLFDAYIHDMQITQKFAKENRAEIARIILKKAGLRPLEYIDTVHNYIDMDSMILRKGSVSAKDGEMLVIPINMAEGSLLCRGKGNEDWNYSAPHGAGRLMSRSKAKGTCTLDDYILEMQRNGVYSTSINENTLDECPMAYKPMSEIISKIGDTVEIVDKIKAIYNFKSSGTLLDVIKGIK